MQEQFVTYEIALKLKELGFDEKCLGYYAGDHLILSVRQQYYPNKVTKAPLWQQVIDWFEKQGLIVYCNIVITMHWEYHIGPAYPPMEEKYGNWIHSQYEYSTRKKAREQAILKCIELCKKN